MRERFERAWAERVQRVREWRGDDDPTPVLEALAHAVVWYLVDAIDTVPSEDRAVLEDAAPAAVAAAREHALASPADRQAWLEAVELAELGRRLLRGEPPSDLAGLPCDLRRPTPRRLAAVLDGRLDGLSAASCAVWCLRHAPDEARLLWALGGASELPVEQAEPILVAAAEPEPMRAPDEGRIVATLGEPAVEAVWFAVDRQLALYAADEVYITFTAPGVTTRDLRPGYWLGTVDAPDAIALSGQLRVGDQVLQWDLSLD